MRKWFNALKVSQKLMLISIFFMMPDSFMLYMFVTGINGDINFARLEKLGNTYQRPLERLLDLIPRHDLLARGLTTNNTIGADGLQRIETQIDSAFDDLAAVDARIGPDLQFTEQGLAKRGRQQCNVRDVRGEWNDLKQNMSVLTPQVSHDRHRQLVADIRTMITHAGDMSNLILDPDLDSYYLMDVTLLALPQDQDRLANVIGDGAAMLGGLSFDVKTAQTDRRNHVRIAADATLLKEADLDRVVASSHTALNEDENFNGISPSLQQRLPPALKEYEGAMTQFINLTIQLGGDEKNSTTAENYIAAGMRARDASFRLWYIADEEVDILLQKRIDGFTYRRAISLFVAAMAFVGAVTLVTFITRSISGPLRAVNEQLLAAMSVADAANVAKSDFLARMSHEIRTPLNGVVGIIDLLQGTELTAVQQRYTRLGRGAASALLVVINDILDFSKIEAGKMPIEAVEFDLHRLAEELTEFLTPEAAKKGLSLACFLLPDVPRHLVGDPNRIRQVLTNLINNAIKFTAHGGVSIRVTLDRRDGDDVIVRLQVEDTGQGIPADRVDRLFKSFSQVDTSTTRKFGGTGLGLVISKRLVELMHGQIGFQSQPDHGSIFWFTLKLRAIATSGSTTVPPSENQPTSAAPVPLPLDSIRGLHLLVAEDNEMNQFVTRETLSRAGCTCDIVADGSLAVAAVQQHWYDVVLMDWQMPVMDGLEATRLIRQREAAIPGSRRIPIVALTANALQGDREKCLLADMDGYVSKPINMPELYSAIGSLAKRTVHPASVHNPRP